MRIPRLEQAKFDAGPGRQHETGLRGPWAQACLVGEPDTQAVTKDPLAWALFSEASIRLKR